MLLVYKMHCLYHKKIPNAVTTPTALIIEKNPILPDLGAQGSLAALATPGTPRYLFTTGKS